MGEHEQALLMKLLEQAIDIARLEAGERAKILALLERLEKDLSALLGSQTLSDMGKAKTNDLIREIKALIQEAYTEVHLDIAATLQGLAPVQASATTHALESALAITIGKGAKPTAQYLETLATNVMIDGSPLKEWWARQAGDLQFRLAAEIRKGALAGETNQQIISRIVGKNGEPGVMQIARKNAAALVQTSMATVANQSRIATFRKNQDIANGMRWTSTLDSHTCEACAVRDGLVWDWDGNPIGHDLPYAEPPLHVNCRCGMTLALKPMSEISGGSLPDIPNNGMRASTDGQVPASMTFEQWFKSRTPEQQAEQFGAGKAAMFRAGKITMRDMLSQDGNPLTLAQLKAKYE